MYWLLRCCLLEEEEQGWLGGLCSSGRASWRWEETQPLSEPVEPERQRDEEPELSVAETKIICCQTNEQTSGINQSDSDVLMEGWLLVSCSCSSSSIQEVMKELSAAGEEDRV